jgi:GrpB-like predicted nucleotidyltransferase (UPF0157 family)
MIEIVDYRASWPQDFRDIARVIRSGLGDVALRIDNIGSTSVPGLCAKDVIDLQISVRVLGRPNQRYALLFRDYLIAHPTTAAAYGELKRRLAPALRNPDEDYPDVKDPAVDLIYLPAQRWAAANGWSPGPSDA